MTSGFSAVWVDQHGNPLEEVQRVESAQARLQMNADSPLMVGGEMVVHSIPSWVNGRQHRIQISRDDVLLAEFVISAESTQNARSNQTISLRLVDPLQRLSAQKLSRPIVAGKGTNVIDFVRGMIETAGEHRIAATPSDAVFAAPQVWEPGDDNSVLSVCNDALASINYWAVHTRAAKFILAPYTLPSQRPIAHEFIAGAGSLMVGEYSQESSFLDVPNRLIAYAPPYEEDGEPFIGIAENTNPLSPYSYQRSGEQWFDAFEQVEADSQATAQAIAERLLTNRTGGNAYVDGVRHLYIPGLWINDRVYAQTAAGDTFDATVNELVIPEYGLCEAKWKLVTSIE